MPSTSFQNPGTQTRYSDLNLSFLPNPAKADDISMLFNADAVKRAVIQLVKTQHYERPFHPEIGCNITTLLFENLSAITAQKVEYQIEQVLSNFEPRVNVSSVIATPDYDNNGLSVSITFYVLNIATSQTISFFLERLR